MTTEATTLPASAEQLEVWLACQREPESGRYNIAIDLEFRPGIDVAAIRAALRDVLAAHPALRSRFTSVDGELVRIVAAEPPMAFLLDRRAEPYQPEDALRWAARVSSAPFDLDSVPLLRAALLVRDGGALLVVTVHHIVADGWSTEILAKDILAAYRTRVTGTAPDDEESEEDTDELDDAVDGDDPDYIHQAEEYWGELLREAPSPLTPIADLVSEDGVPGEPRYVGRVVPDELLAGIRAMAEAERGSPALILLSAWSILLHAWSGRDDGTFGVVFSGRLTTSVAKEVNLRSRVLPMRLPFDLTRSFGDVVGALRVQLLDSLECSEISSQRLLAVRREQTEGPTAERTVFLHGTANEVDWDLDGTTVRLVEHEAAVAKYEFSFAALEGRQDMRIRIDYDSARFRTRTVELFIDEMLALLAAAVADPASTCADLLQASDELAMAGLCPHDPPAVPSVLVPDLVRGHAERRPDAIAIRHDDRAISYGELVTTAASVAHWLRGHGVRTGDTVGLLLPPGANTPLLWLAVLFAGAAYVPLDPAYPSAQLQLALDNAQPPVLVIDPSCDREVTLPGGLVVTIADVLAESATEPTTPPDVEIGPESRFNVLYTSGSTGRPKGVVLPHRGVARMMARPDFVPLDDTDVLSQLSPLNFDGATYEVWGALTHGAELVVFEKELVLSPRELREAVRANGVTTLLVTTPLLNRIIEDVPDMLQSLRRVYFGGEIISVTHIRRALRWAQPGTLLHSYGPTENSFTSTWFPITEAPEGTRTLPIGRPVPGTQAHVVLPGSLRHAPRGVPGELVLGGVGVAHGYLGDAEMTEKRFVPDPFATDPAARLYRTGDRVRLTPDGLLEFIGRDDNQVKIRSQRVELGEVESAISVHPGVEAVFVTVRMNQREEKEIVAYAVAGQPGTDAEDIKRHAHTVLPSFAVPRHVVLMDALPLTPTGKIDRRKLPAPDEQAPKPGRPGAPKRKRRTLTTPTEAVRTAWKTVLGHDVFGPDQNFFDAGGHSLLLVKLQEALRVETGTAPSIRDLLRHPTVRTQTELVGGNARPIDMYIEPIIGPAPKPKAEQPASPVAAAPADERRHQIIAVSATTADALAAIRQRLAQHLAETPSLRLDDVALTLDVGRERFGHRFATVVPDLAEAEAALLGAEPASEADGMPPRIVFAFGDPMLPSEPGAGSVAYQLFATVRHRVDEAATLTGAAPDGAAWLADCPQGTEVALRSALQIGIADQLIEWGVAPTAFCGVGAGQVAAECADGEIELDAALARIADWSAAQDQASAYEVLADAGADPNAVIVDIGLAPSVPQVGPTVPTLVPGTPDDRALLTAVAQLWRAGLEPQLAADGRGRRVRLPGHPLAWHLPATSHS